MPNEQEQDDERPTFSRRRIVLGGGALALGAVAWQQWHGSESIAPSSSGPPRAGGELNVAFDGAAQPRFTLDPHNSGFAPHNRVIRSIYDGLTVLLPDQTIGPWLAEGWDISPDRTSYLFTLRKGVAFHDGTPFDAAALKANFDRLKDPQNALYSRNSLGPYETAEIVAPDRLRVNLSEPFTPLLRNLSSTKLGIISPTALAKHGKLFAQNPVGTGPFRFTGLTQGTEIRLERNPAYQWAPSTAAHQGPAHLERLIFKNVPEEATRVAVLQSGQVQVSDLIPPQNLAAIEANSNFRLLQKELLETNYSLMLNVAKAPWNDPDIRRAVRLSLDIDAIVRVIYLGRFTRAWSSLTPTMFGSAEKELAGSWKPDVEEAARILDAKGWKRGPGGIRVKNGQKLEISFIDTQGNREKRLDVIQLARRQLAANGIELRIDSQPTGAYATKVTQGDYDLAAGASFHADPDILRVAYSPKVRSAITGNKVDDPEITDWLTQAAREPEGPGRAELYRKTQRKIIDQTYGIPIYILRYNLATSRAVSGVTLDAHGFPEFHGAWLNG